MNKDLEERLKKPEFLIRTGSMMYGYSTPSSDEDVRGFISVPYNYLLGRSSFDQFEINDNKEKVDRVIYSLPKFFKMLEKGVPNICEMLWVDEKNIIEIDTIGLRLMDNRDLFVSKHLIDAIIGFSTSEYNKVINPKWGEKGEARRELIQKYGYDVKSMAHSIRLLYQGWELLHWGNIKYPLSIAPQLLECRQGKLTIEQAQTWYRNVLDGFHIAKQTPHNLFECPDRQKKLDQLYYELIRPEIEIFMEHNNDKNIT